MGGRDIGKRNEGGRQTVGAKGRAPTVSSKKKKKGNRTKGVVPSVGNGGR